MARLTLNHFSQTLQMGMTLTACLPEKAQGIGMNGNAGWDGERPLKTLYLLHGNTDDQTSWQRQTSIERYAMTHNLAVIMPTTHLAAYTNQRYGLRYFDYIAYEVPEISGRYFPLSDRREDQFVAGLSMGGYGAMKIGLSRPDFFSHIISLSPGIDRLFLVREMLGTIRSMEDLRARQQDLPPDHHKRLMQFFTNFGSVDEYERSDHDNLFELAKTVARGQTHLPNIYVACGTEDFLLEPNRRFHQLLSQLGIEHEYHEAPGIHNWEFWDEHIQHGLNWIFHHG